MPKKYTKEKEPMHYRLERDKEKGGLKGFMAEGWLGISETAQKGAKKLEENRIKRGRNPKTGEKRK